MSSNMKRARLSVALGVIFTFAWVCASGAGGRRPVHVPTGLRAASSARLAGGLLPVMLEGDVGAAPAPGTRTMSLGVNVDQNNNNVEAGIWNDVSHGFSNWYNGQINSSGYPITNGAQCQSLMIGCPGGAYTLTFDGTAVITPGFGPTLSNLTKIGVTTTATLNVPRANCQTMFTATGLNPADPLRNMHIYMPGANASSPVFRAQWTRWFTPFTTTRAIDWPPVNSPGFSPATQPATFPPVTWANRVLPTNWDQSTHGVAWEYFFVLCQQTGTVPWINVPYLADDDYVCQLAKLASTYNFQKVYLETGNENWNSGFGQWTVNYDYANVPPNMAVDGNIVNGVIVQSATPVTNANTRAARLAAEKARHIGFLFRSVLGANRVQVVLAGQLANTQWLNDGTQWLQAKYGDLNQSISCLAVAFYFPNNQPSSTGATLQSIAAASSTFLNGDFSTFTAAHAKLAAQYNLPLVGYEAGQNFYAWTNPTTGSNGLPVWPATDLPVVIQTDPLMGQLYNQMLTICQSYGVTLLNHNSFVRPWAKGGLFALQEDLNENPAIKWSTLSAFAALPMAPAPGPTPTPSTQPATIIFDPVTRTATVH